MKLLEGLVIGWAVLLLWNSLVYCLHIVRQIVRMEVLFLVYYAFVQGMYQLLLYLGDPMVSAYLVGL